MKPEIAPSPFAHMLHADAVRQLSDSRSYQRGERYFREGRVAATVRHGSRIEGRVRGSSDYAVSLWIKGDRLAYSCTCPLSAEGAFCKHCVAVALSWLDENGMLEVQPDTLELIERYLTTLDKGELVQMLVVRARSDADLLAHLVTLVRRN